MLTRTIESASDAAVARSTTTSSALPASILTERERITRAFSPDIQPLCAADPVRCYYGTAPTLAAVGRRLGDDYAVLWLASQIDYYVASLAEADRMESEDIRLLAITVYANYRSLNLAEIMLFFAQLAGGAYGQVAYGRIRPENITAKIPEFLLRRRCDIDAVEQRSERQRRDAEIARRDARAVSLPEYRRILADLAHVRFGGDLDKATAFIAANPDFDFRAWCAQNIQDA